MISPENFKKTKPPTKKRRLRVMKKNAIRFILAIIVGIFILPTVLSATTFNLPSPVYVSGDVSGELYFRSENPAALDMIDGVIQFSNDIMKSRGWGMTKNAFRISERINSKLLLVHLYRDTLSTQFSFNVKHGSLWGPIPSCMLIPDGKTVIIEYSGPSRDSEDGNGGHHFSLIAGITDSSYYKAVGNIMPCPSGMVQPVEVPVQVSPAPAPVIQAPSAPAPAVVTTSVAVAKIPTVKKPKTKKCDPCEEIQKLQGTVGEATPEEKASGLGDLHKKSTKQLEVNKETQEAVGKDTPKDGEKPKSLHEKEDENNMLLRKIDAKTPPLPPPKDSDWIMRMLKEFWILLALLILAVALGGNYYYKNYYRRRNP